MKTRQAVTLLRYQIRRHSRSSRAILAAIDSTLESETGYALEDLRAQNRHSERAGVRQLAMTLARELTDASALEIARHWHRADHNTTLHACRAVHAKCAKDPAFDAHFLKLARRIAAAVTGADLPLAIALPPMPVLP